MTPSGELTPTPTPMYQSELAQIPLPEILATVHKYRAPGVVECRRGEDVKRIYLDRGRIVFASTSRIEESLGDTLLRDGRITREQYDESVRRFHQTGKRHGVTLVEMGVLTPHDLFVAVREHIQEIIWSVFAWNDGQVSFTPGREKNLEFVKVEISVPEAILRGVRKLPDPKPLLARIGNKTTVLIRTPPTADDDSVLAADEQELLAAVDGKHTLFELVSRPPYSAGDNARILYGLYALQLIAAKAVRPITVQVRVEGKQTK